MIFVPIDEADARLSDLIHGEELLLTENDRIVAQFVRTPTSSTRSRQLGGLAGTVLYMAEDFDKDLMEMGAETDGR